MTRTSITIVLELDQTVDALTGTARRADGTRRTFHGWLGLAEAIDVLVDLSRTSGATPPADQRPAGAERRHRPLTRRETKE